MKRYIKEIKCLDATGGEVDPKNLRTLNYTNEKNIVSYNLLRINSNIINIIDPKSIVVGCKTVSHFQLKQAIDQIENGPKVSQKQKLVKIQGSKRNLCFKEDIIDESELYYITKSNKAYKKAETKFIEYEQIEKVFENSWKGEAEYAGYRINNVPIKANLTFDKEDQRVQDFLRILKYFDEILDFLNEV